MVAMISTRVCKSSHACARRAWLVAIVCLAGCAAESERASGAAAPIVYGVDDRVDYYEAPAALQLLTRQSIVALMYPSRLDISDPADVRVTADTLGFSYNLCATERFTDQLTAAHCSGTLIADDLVLTAGHCFNDADPAGDCGDTRFVFDYFYEDAGTLSTIDEAQDVYSCRQIVVRRNEETADRQMNDYAIVQLDRPVHSSHTPAPVTASSAPIGLGTAVTIVGFGSGIPAKIDTGGSVVDERAATLDFFRATTDSFGGNSGSGVFDSERRVIGILVRGEQDYVGSIGCNIVNVVGSDPGEAGGEQINYVGRAIDALCAVGWPSALCGIGDTCGDSRCTGDETPASCSADCAASTCGDGVCDLAEDDLICGSDCAAPPQTVPAEWTCPPGFYSTFDGCDCGCGAQDPDCGIVGQSVYGCESGQTCEAGACAGATITVPTEWACPVAYYEARDGCDCGCGAHDPDCDTGMTVYGCEPAVACVAGICEVAPVAGAGPPRSGGRGGCSVSNAPSSVAWLLTSALVALAIRRRRR